MVWTRLMRSSCLPIASSFDHAAELLGERIEDGQFNVEFTFPEFLFPEFLGSAFSQRLAKRVDVLATGVPSLLAGGDLDAMVDEPGADGILGFVDSAVEGL